VGKLADLVILERNPLTVDPATIKTIAVLETIKEGRTIFRREPAVASAGTSTAGPNQLLAAAGSRPCLHDHDHGAVPPLSPAARRTLELLVQASR
jgi:hypothetical protein